MFLRNITFKRSFGNFISNYSRAFQLIYVDLSWFHLIADSGFNSMRIINTAQKMKFSIKDFFSKCDQIRRKLRIWSHLLKKSLIKNFILRGVPSMKATEPYMSESNFVKGIRKWTQNYWKWVFDVSFRKDICKSMHDVTTCSNLAAFQCGETKIEQTSTSVVSFNPLTLSVYKIVKHTKNALQHF